MKVEKLCNHAAKAEPDAIFERLKLSIAFIFGFAIATVIYLITSKL